MKTAILGAGALGSVIGAALYQNKADVCLLDVNAEHIRAINADGLRFEQPEGTSLVPIPAMLPQNCPNDVALIILLTKVAHTERALAQVKPVIDAGALVLSIQNGLGNGERVARHVPPNQVLFGSTMTPGRFLGPGHVATQGLSWTLFKALNAQGVAGAETVAAQFAGAGFEYRPDAEVAIWQKAAFNCAMNATCALSDGKVGSISARADARAMVGDIAEEVIAVAAARGIPVDRAAVHQQLEFALENHQAHKPSMLQDMEAGRETEIEALCGEVDRVGAQTGVATPLNRALATLVRLKQANRVEDPK